MRWSARPGRPGGCRAGREPAAGSGNHGRQDARRDGIDAAAEIAANRIAPVVVLTAFSQRELVEKARDAGAMAYLVKPFSISDLIPAIELAASRFSEIISLEREVAGLE